MVKLRIGILCHAPAMALKTLEDLSGFEIFRSKLPVGQCLQDFIQTARSPEKMLTNWGIPDSWCSWVNTQQLFFSENISRPGKARGFSKKKSSKFIISLSPPLIKATAQPKRLVLGKNKQKNNIFHHNWFGHYTSWKI